MTKRKTTVRCEKKKFASEVEAKEFNKGMTPYWCTKGCECWHLTSNGRFAIFKASGHPADALEWIQRHSRSRKKRRK